MEPKREPEHERENGRQRSSSRGPKGSPKGGQRNGKGVQMEPISELKAKPFQLKIEASSGGGSEVILGRPRGRFAAQVHCFRPVSYTHLTLPTKWTV